jgi:GT2 family glycosyltransferase
MPTSLRRLLPPTAPGSDSHAATLLRPDPDLDAVLDFDRLQRYSRVSELIDRLCTGLAGPVRVLEVGCNVLNDFPRFFDPERVHVTRCDVYEDYSRDPEYVRVDPDGPLPFADESFDVVAGLEVLEHIPREKRPTFVAESLRVARRGAVFTCPNGTPAVRAAEQIVMAAFQARHNRPHDFLREHAEFGLPTQDEVHTILRHLDVPHAVIRQAPLDQWLAVTLLGEALDDGPAWEDMRREFIRTFKKGTTGEMAAEYYRSIYVCAKTFDATGALELEPQVETGNDRSSAGAADPTASALQQLTTAAARVLSTREFLYRTMPATLNSVIDELQNGLKAQEERFFILHNYVEALQNSVFWRALGPLRWLRELLRPKGFGAQHLLPWRNLEPVSDAPPGTWKAIDDDPQFMVSCYLPAGWLRVRMKLFTPDRGHIEFYAERGGNFSVECLLGQFSLSAGQTEEEFFLHLERPARAIRVDPFNKAGVFRVDQLDVTPRPGPLTIVDALRRKLRLLRAYRCTGPTLWRGLKLLLTGRWKKVAAKWALGLNDPRCTRHGFYEAKEAYKDWIERRQLADEDRMAHKEWAASLDDPPRVSILMPVYNTPEHYLRLAIDSVLRQTYPHWELCIADDGSTAEHVRPVLEEYAAEDDRIRLASPGRHGGIAAASNAALNLATGDYVALLDHDDEIAEHALYRMAQAIVADPSADMLYSDEDKLSPGGERVMPFFKPDWSPEFFLGCMYTCHFGLYRASLVREVGGFRSDFDCAQDYDLVLRLTERTDRVVHVPDVLYHWRLLPNSTAAGVAAKPHAHAAGLRAVQEHLERTGRRGTAEVGPSAGLNHVRFVVTGQPLVSILIPSLCQPGRAGGREPSHLERCIGSIVRQSHYRRFEVIVLDQHRMSDAMERDLKRFGVRRVTYDEAFNWSRVNNLGAEHATGDHLLFLNDDTEVIAKDWLEALLEFSQQPAIGAVGAKLLFPDGTLQHVGVTLLDGKPGHPFYSYPAEHPGYYCRNHLPHNCAAVTGACLMTRRDVFQRVGGFDESFPLNYNDVDYCLRVRQRGYRVVFTPHAELYHHESVTKDGVFPEELAAFQARWGEHCSDPFYNQNLNMETYDYRIGH